jgi:L-2-hydroxyglutarate oxidase LhgO
VVIGAGVVGLACAAALARRGLRVVVLERNAAPARETSSRNSGVVHAGLYYPPESLKARACVEGRRLVFERCARSGIAHRRVGKLVVATEQAELAPLDAIRRRGLACGAGALEWIDARELARREPRVRALAAVWSPESGIVDAHELASSFQAEAESHGASVVTRTRVIGLVRRGSLWRVETAGADGAAHAVEAPWVVNAAGLEADRVAALAGLDVDALGWRIRPCKGDYFALAPALGAVTRHLVYPAPSPSSAGLGVHVTMDLAGRYRLGPDAEYVDAPRYDVDPARAEAFARAAARYLPGIEAAQLSPDIAGVRPKLQGPGEGFRDFVLEESSARGAPGMIQLVGIESPGLTAAPALAERVAALVA